MITKKEFHRLQDRRITKSKDAPYTAQLSHYMDYDDPRYEVIDQKGDVLMRGEFPKSGEAMLEMMNNLIECVVKQPVLKL